MVVLNIALHALRNAIAFVVWLFTDQSTSTSGQEQFGYDFAESWCAYYREQNPGTSEQDAKDALSSVWTNLTTGVTDYVA